MIKSKKLIMGVLALMMIISAVFVTLSFSNTDSAKAVSEITYTDAGSKAAQDHLTRYLITVNASADVGASKTVNFEVYKDGVSMGNKAFDIYRASASSSYFLIDYGTLTGNASITLASSITNRYVIVLRKGTAVGGYTVAEDVFYNIYTDSITITNSITYSHTSSATQDHLDRYLITVSASLDVGSSKDIGFEVTKNGVSIGKKTINIYRAGASSSYFLVDYGTLVSGATTCAEIVDEYVITLKKGTVVGNYYVAQDISYYIKGDTVNYYKGDISYTHSGAGAQDGSRRYLITVNASVDVGSSKDISFAVTKNGESIGNKTFTIWRENASASYFLITYGTLTGDNAITTASGVTDEYIVTLKKGTFVGYYYVAQDISYYIKGDTVKLYKGDISYTHSSASAQDHLTRYLITVNASFDVGGSKTVNFEVYKNGVSMGNKAFDIYKVNATTSYFIINYSQLVADATNAEQIADTYVITLKKGTFVGDYRVARDTSYSICKYALKAYMDVTNISARFEDSESLKRYFVEVSTGNVNIAVDYVNASFEVYKNGDLVGNKTFEINKRFAGQNKALFLIPYATLTDNASVTTAAQVTDTYRITLKKGAIISDFILANDVSYYINGEFISNAISGDIAFTHSSASVQNANLRYVATLNTSNDMGESKNVLFEVYKNGELVDGGIYFQINRVSASQAEIYFTFDALTGEDGITNASSVTDTYVVTLKKWTIIGNYVVQNSVIYYVNGNSITDEIIGEISFTHALSSAQDAQLRYLASLSVSADIGSHREVTFEVHRNGELIDGGLTFTMWRVDASNVYFLFTYATLTGDNNVTTAMSVTDAYVVTLKKGTIIGNYLVSQDVTYSIGKASILKTEMEENIILIEDTLNGSVTSDKVKATKRMKVVLTITPDENYVVTALKINNVYQDLSRIVDGKFILTMPSIAVTVSAEFSNSVLVVQQGASIRLIEPIGIRFSFKLDVNYFNSLENGAVVGCLFGLQNKVGNALMIDGGANVTTREITDWQTQYTPVDGFVKINVAIHGIPSPEYAKEMIFRAFIRTESGYVYSEQTVRSVEDVVKNAINSGDVYSEEQQEVIDGLFADIISREVSTATISVRSADSTTKFKKNETNKGNVNYGLTYNMVRNEYESYQLLVSANADVSSFYLTKSNLTCGSNVLSANNFNIFMQRYSTVSTSTDLTTYGSGDYPDALIPIDNAKKSGELTITANKNSALWITVYVPKDTVAGTYTGEFILNVGGNKFFVPVSVTVNDYTLTDDIHANTSFSWRYESVIAGEKDCSEELLQAYYDFFLDYRISLENPVTSNPNNDAVEFADSIINRWDKITSYTFMPLWGVGPTGTLTGGQLVAVKEQILEVASRSSLQTNYLSKGLIYFIDEPDLTNATVLDEVITKIQGLNVALNELVTQITNDTTGKFDNFKHIPNWQDEIRNIRNIIPMNLEHIYGKLSNAKVVQFLELANCLCPVWKNQSDARYTATAQTLRETYGIELWWYGCVQPKAPYSTYHIADTNLLSSRSITWLQLMYGMAGTLYWDGAGYTYYAGNKINEFCDLYAAPYRTSAKITKHIFTDTAGDGFLTYAGSRYGVFGPLSSLRLMSIRDGNEEYELLYDLRAKLVERYGEAYAQSEIERLCSSLYYDGSKFYANGNSGLDFGSLRTELINLLVNFEA